MKPASHRVKPVDLLWMLAILAMIAIVYLPVGRAEFIWDDKTAFHDEAWLRHGDAWLGYLRRGFSGWINYFRPLVVAFFTLQVRLFDSTPGPMHYVSLILHLANTLLIGLLAMRFINVDGIASRERICVGIAMLLYGLHPAMVEPVVWISCQYEMLVTLFVLLALYANATLTSPAARALAVGACFFLAACAKESAAALPLLMFIYDWSATSAQDTRIAARIGAIWKKQKFVYLGLALAASLYLLARHEALGFLIAPSGNEGLFSVARLQKVCYTYLAYWRLTIWPMQGLGPLHEVDAQQFINIGLPSLMIDVAAILVALLGCYGFVRGRPIGYLIMSFGAGLIAVLNIVPVTFVESVYHERYLMTSLAVVCAWLPCVILSIKPGPGPLMRVINMAGIAVVALWLGLAVLNIRVTMPLWADEMSLWQWALRQNPQSVLAKQYLLTQYMTINDHERARALADEFIAAKVNCPNCMLNAALLALDDGDIERTTLALESLKRGTALASDYRLLHGFILASGELAELKHDDVAAEDAYRDAITSDPGDPASPARMALLLVRLGRMEEARHMQELSLALYAVSERGKQIAAFERAVAAYKQQQPPKDPAANPANR